MARGTDPKVEGLLRLSLGDVSFTEIFGMFFIGYSIGLIISGPPEASGTRTGPPPPPAGRFAGRLNPFARGGSPVAVGTALALITFLVRVDILGRLTNPQSYKSVAAIIGAEGTAVQAIPAGGHGQITFREPSGNLVGVIAAADVDVAQGARVRIVGTRGLNPLVVPE